MLHPADIFLVWNMKCAVDDTKNSFYAQSGRFGGMQGKTKSLFRKNALAKTENRSHFLHLKNAVRGTHQRFLQIQLGYLVNWYFERCKATIANGWREVDQRSVWLLGKLLFCSSIREIGLEFMSWLFWYSSISHVKSTWDQLNLD